MSFKKDFFWGAATAAYQIEGAYNEDGKGLNIWDEFCTTKGKIERFENGNAACDHYHRYKEDVKLMAEMGLKAYRFSISWARILPEGSGRINPKGIEFYNILIDELLKYNITPFVTLYHWDLPYVLHQKGGWLNPESTKWFEEYTTVVAKNFGDRVKNFITFNEPSVFMMLGYGDGTHAPGLTMNTKDILQVGHNIHMAHGKAVRVLREYVKDCKVGITVATQPKIPLTKDDEEMAYNAYFYSGLGGFAWAQSYWLDPIVFGHYPEQLLKEAGDLFPAFSAGDMELINEKIDFIGLNIYEAQYCGKGDCNLKQGYPHTELGWGTYDEALKWGVLHNWKRYNLPIIITENGISTHDWVHLDGKVHDSNRIDFLHRYLKGLKESTEMGCQVDGYFHWSLMDNFEWAKGYNPRFGLIYINYQTMERTMKDSAFWYKEVIQSNGENL